MVSWCSLGMLWLFTILFCWGMAATSPRFTRVFCTSCLRACFIWSLFLCSSYSLALLISFYSRISSSFSFLILFSSYCFLFCSWTTSLIASSRFFYSSYSCIFLVSYRKATTRSMGWRVAACLPVLLFCFAFSSALAVAYYAILNTSSIGMLWSVSSFTEISARLAAFGPPFFFFLFFSASTSACDSVSDLESNFNF